MKKLILILLIAISYSCSSTHLINIKKDNSATVSFSITNKDSLVETLIEWGAIENRESDSIFDLNEIKNGLSSNKNLDNVILSNPQTNNFLGSFTVKNIDNLFYDSTKDVKDDIKIFSITENNNEKTLTIKLSLANYKLLKKSLPILQEESIDMLGPDSNQDVSKEEYLDMMSFSLGEDGPEDIMGSNISLKIDVEGSITNIIGGEIINSNTAQFTIPLLDVILLKKTLVYSLTYK